MTDQQLLSAPSAPFALESNDLCPQPGSTLMHLQHRANQGEPFRATIG
jgi:hypothetical protein